MKPKRTITDVIVEIIEGNIHVIYKPLNIRLRVKYPDLSRKDDVYDPHDSINPKTDK